MFKNINCAWAILRAKSGRIGASEGKETMPYPRGHKAKTRERIIERARLLFNKHGFASVSIDEIMAEVGLTRGGFYNHFDTKEDLYAEAVMQVLSTQAIQRWSEYKGPGPVLAREFIATYLSQAHFDCPLMALASDVARGGEPVRRAYRQVLEAIVGTLEKGVAGPDQRRHALAVATLCIGGMVIARAVDDAELAQEIREAAKELATSVTAWNQARIGTEAAKDLATSVTAQDRARIEAVE